MYDLTYRDVDSDDFDVIHKMASDWNIVRQLGSWPWPPDPAYSKRRSEPYTGNGFVWAVCDAGKMCGTVCVTHGELGYCLDPAFAGRGITTQAAAAAISHAFATSDIDRIDAHVWHDNPASVRVLAKLGFLHWFSAYEMSNVRKTPVLSQSHRLLRSDWTA